MKLSAKLRNILKMAAVTCIAFVMILLFALSDVKILGNQSGDSAPDGATAEGSENHDDYTDLKLSLIHI